MREAEAELYRVRMQTLGRVAILQHEVAAARASADQAKGRHANTRSLNERHVISAAELALAQSAMQKFAADLAAKEAELDAVIGKHAAKALSFSGISGRGVDLAAADKVIRVWRRRRGNGPSRRQPVVARL